MDFDKKLTLEYDAEQRGVVEADSASDAIEQFKAQADERDANYTGVVVQDSAELTSATSTRVYLVTTINNRDLKRKL